MAIIEEKKELIGFLSKQYRETGIINDTKVRYGIIPTISGMPIIENSITFRHTKKEDIEEFIEISSDKEQQVFLKSNLQSNIIEINDKNQTKLVDIDGVTYYYFVSMDQELSKKIILRDRTEPVTLTTERNDDINTITLTQLISDVKIPILFNGKQLVNNNEINMKWGI